MFFSGVESLLGGSPSSAPYHHPLLTRFCGERVTVGEGQLLGSCGAEFLGRRSRPLRVTAVRHDEKKGGEEGEGKEG